MSISLQDQVEVLEAVLKGLLRCLPGGRVNITLRGSDNLDLKAQRKLHNQKQACKSVLKIIKEERKTP